MTSSSSECDCDDCPYDCCISSNGRNPFYPTIGQPLIYYAQMPQVSSRRQHSRERREDNRNCFVKAFRWYTQDHAPFNDSPKNDVNAFAVWLDSKYEQFLRDSQLGKSKCYLGVKQSSVIEAARKPTSSCCKPRRKRFRMKSPWRRKHKEAGDVVHKLHESFEYILQPKDLYRPTSEFFQQSTTTIISTEIPVKSSIKSKSYTSISQHICKDKPVNMVHEDFNVQKLETIMIKVDEINKEIESKNNLCAIFCNENTPQNKPTSSQSVTCQCPLTKVMKKNTRTQCACDDSVRVDGDNGITAREMSQLCDSDCLGRNEFQRPAVFPKQVQVGAIQNSIQCQCSEDRLAKSQELNQHEPLGVEQSSKLSNLPSTSKTCPCESSKEEFKAENLSYCPSPITYSNDTAQTSDHSINLEKEDANGNPLFLKIICAAKLWK